MDSNGTQKEQRRKKEEMAATPTSFTSTYTDHHFHHSNSYMRTVNWANRKVRTESIFSWNSHEMGIGRKISDFLEPSALNFLKNSTLTQYWEQFQVRWREAYETWIVNERSGHVRNTIAYRRTFKFLFRPIKPRDKQSDLGFTRRKRYFFQDQTQEADEISPRLE